MNISLNMLMNLGIMILAGIFMGRLMKHLGFPNVTGYMLAGLLLGPYLLPALGCPISVLSEGFVSGISVITDVALGLIAFSVGGQLHFSYMRRAGKAPIILALVESIAAAVCVSLALMLTGNGPGMALIMGSIAAATAPAATILVVQQYRARGPVTNLLLQVVALDDVTALLLYSISAAVIKHFGAEGKQILAAVLKEVLRFMEGAALGLLLAILLLFVLRFFRRRSNRLAIVCGFLFLAIGGAQRLGLNALIVCMVMGMAIANLSAEADAVLECVEPIAAPVFILFFVASGAGLPVNLLRSVGIIGLVYILARYMGKILGTLLGGALTGTDRRQCLHLGPCLLPQAGIAIGLTLAAGSVLPKHASNIRAIVLTGTLICELVGPAVTRLSLKKAGEISPSP